MKHTKKVKILLLFAFIIATLLSCSSENKLETSMDYVNTIDLSHYSSDAPDSSVHILFIHHSIGGQLLADKGLEIGKDCIYTTQSNGGGLRKLLESHKYIVHEASYGSILGEKTDICNWRAKFRDHMKEILTCKQQDQFFQDGTRNSIIVFKSCYPNNWIESDGFQPGDPDSCTRTMANCKAAYLALLEYFRQRPDTLFVVITAPPMAKPVLYKKGKVLEFIKTITGRPDTLLKVGKRARDFNNWLKDSKAGWLKDYKMKNVVVFDYYGILTKHGQSDWLLYPTGQYGTNSHPNSEGNTIAANEFSVFLSKAFERFNGK